MRDGVGQGGGSDISEHIFNGLDKSGGLMITPCLPRTGLRNKAEGLRNQMHQPEAHCPWEFY